MRETSGKKSKLIIVVLTVLCALWLAQFAPMNFLKPSVISAVKSQADIDIVIDGDVNIGILPFPRLIVNQISSTSNENLKARSIELSPSITKLLMGKIHFTSILFDNMEASIDLSKASTKKNAAIEVMIFVNSALEVKNAGAFSGKINNINGSAKLFSSYSQSINLDINFEKDDTSYKLNASFSEVDNLGNAKGAQANLVSDVYSIKLKGDIATLFANPSFDGECEFSLNKYPTPEDTLQVIINQILEVENLKITSKASLKDENLILDNIKILSTHINSGSGYVNISFKDVLNINGDINVDEVNVDGVINAIQASYKNNDSGSSLELLVRNIMESFSFSASSKTTADAFIHVNNVIINEKKISNVDLVLNLFNGELSLGRLQADLPGNSKYYMDGIISNNGIRPLFKGNIIFSIEDNATFGAWINLPNLKNMLDSSFLKMKASVSFMPRNLKIHSVKIIYDKANALGKYVLKSNGEKKMTSKLTLRFNVFNMDDYQISSSFDDIVNNLFAFDNDKSGILFMDYLNDFKWLREFKLNLGLDLSFDSFQFKNKVFSDLAVNLSIVPNKILLDSFSLKDSQMPIAASGAFALSALQPELNVDIKFANLNTSLFDGVMPTLEAMQKYQRTLLPSIIEKKKITDINLDDFFSRDLNLFSLHNFTGGINLKIDNLTTPTTTANDIAIKIYFIEGGLQISKFIGKIFGGAFEIVGNIGNQSAKIPLNIYFAFNNFNPKAMFKSFYGLDMPEGYYSASGNISTSGADIVSMHSAVNGSVKFLGAKSIVRSYGIGELIKVSEVKFGKAKTKDIISFYSKKGQSLFDTVTGSVNIKNGIASANDIKFSNNRVSGVMAANVELVNWQVNGIGKLSFLPAANTSSIGLDFALKGSLIDSNYLNLNVGNLESYISLRDANSDGIERSN